MHPTQSQLDTARIVVSNPDKYHSQPTVIGTAWATLKEARGQTVDFDRLRGTHHLIEHSACAARITAKVRKIMITKDYSAHRGPHFDGAA